jgi:hypothetical protein
LVREVFGIVIAGDIVHYLTIMVAAGVALAVFGMFYRGIEGDKMWNAGLLIAVFGVFSQEWVLHAPPWPAPVIITGIIALLLFVRLLGVVPALNQPVSNLWKNR